MTGVDPTCIFCAIAGGEAPADVVFEDEATLAFLDINPAADGHTLVIPRIHAPDLFEVSVDQFVAVARTVHRVADLLDRQLSPDGLNIFQANRSAGWQEVYHLHVHLVPRWHGDELRRPWRPKAQSSDHLGSLLENLRKGWTSDYRDH